MGCGLEQGQLIEECYSSGCLTQDEKHEIAFSSFPDSISQHQNWSSIHEIFPAYYNELMLYICYNNRNWHIPYSKEIVVQIKILHIKKNYTWHNIKYVIYQKLNIT